MKLKVKHTFWSSNVKLFRRILVCIVITKCDFGVQIFVEGQHSVGFSILLALIGVMISYDCLSLIICVRKAF